MKKMLLKIFKSNPHHVPLLVEERYKLYPRSGITISAQVYFMRDGGWFLYKRL